MEEFAFTYCEITGSEVIFLYCSQKSYLQFKIRLDDEFSHQIPSPITEKWLNGKAFKYTKYTVEDVKKIKQ